MAAVGKSKHHKLAAGHLSKLFISGPSPRSSGASRLSTNNATRNEDGDNQIQPRSSGASRLSTNNATRNEDGDNQIQPRSSGASRLSTNNATRNEDGDNQIQKPKSTTKTKKAREMAQLINKKLTWSKLVRSNLSSLARLPLSKTTVLQTLYLIKNPSKALQFFNWVQSDNSYNHDHHSYLAMLEILGNARHLNSARNLLYSIPKRSNSSVNLDARFFNILMNSYGRAGLFHESMKVFNSMKEMGVSPSTVTFNSLLSILLKRGRTGIALQLYDEMLKTYGVTPDVITFNILIRGFCLNGMVDEGLGFFNEMQRFKSEPDVVTYNTLVDGLCRAGKAKFAWNLVKAMWTKGEQLSPNVVTYTTLIRGFCADKAVDDALAVFNEMIDRRIKPNKVTYNTIIKGLCEARRLDNSMLREILEGFNPDICTFNILMNAHCNAGKLEEAVALFKRLPELQIRPDSASYSVLIRAFCQLGDFMTAEELFDELSDKEILLANDGGSVPLVAAYNPMFEYLCTNGKTQKADKVFRKLMKRGTQDPLSYKTLIMGHCKEGTYVSAYSLLLWMLRRDYVPDFETYQCLIDGLLQQKSDPIVARQTLEMMLRSSHLPMASTFHSILSELLRSGHADDCAKLVMLMLERKVRQNINLSTSTLILLFKSGMSDKAFNVLRRLYEGGFTVRIDEVVSFLSAGKKQQLMLLNAREMLLFGLSKHGKVDIDLSNSVINCLCKMGKTSEAFGLFYELVDKGQRHEQLNCLEELKASLESDGKSKEAEFVLKRMGS